MSIWSKVLVGLIIVVALVNFYLATRTLRTHQHWQEAAIAFQAKIDDARQEHKELALGVGAELGKVDQAQLDLFRLLVDRGRAWYHCQPQINQQTRAIGVVTALPDPHGITPKTVVAVFEDGRWVSRSKAGRDAAAGSTESLPLVFERS